MRAYRAVMAESVSFSEHLDARAVEAADRRLVEPPRAGGRSRQIDRELAQPFATAFRRLGDTYR